MRKARIDRIMFVVITIICIGTFATKCVKFATTKDDYLLEELFSEELQNQNAYLTYDFDYETETQQTNTTDEKEIEGITDSKIEFVNLSNWEVTTEETTTTKTTTKTTTETTTETTTDTTTKVYSTRLNRYITSEEMYFLTMICVSEAGIEDYTGKVAVVATVLNRLESQAYSNTVYGVIFDPDQFSSATNGVFHNGTVVLKYEDIPEYTLREAEAAVLAALDGVDPTWEVGGALFFYNPDYCSYEENAKRANISAKMRIGNHVFYRIWDV